MNNNGKADNANELNEMNNSSLREIVDAVRALPEVEVPKGFHEEIMRAIRIEASAGKVAADKKRKLPNITKILNRKHIYIAASVACLALVILAVLPLTMSKGGRSAQYTDSSSAYYATPSAPAAAAAPMPAPMAEPPFAPGIMEQAAMENSMVYGNSGGIPEESYDYEGMAELAATRELSGASADISAQANAMREGGRLDESDGDSKLANSENQSSNENIAAQKIIMTAHYSLHVTDFDKTVDKIHDIAEIAGGYVESYSSSIYNTYYSEASGSQRDLKSGYIRLRVPQNEYSYSKIKLADLGKIISTSEEIDNITSRYVDTAARLDVKKTEEQRLLELYGKAEKIEDLISLETRLAYVRADIESMMSQLQNWDRSVTFSTINISIDEIADYSQLQAIDPTLGEKITEGFYRSVASFTRGIERLIVGIAENSIALIIIAVIVLGLAAAVRRAIYKRNNGRNEDE